MWTKKNSSDSSPRITCSVFLATDKSRDWKIKREENDRSCGPSLGLGLTHLPTRHFTFLGLESEEWTHRSAPDLTTHPAHPCLFLSCFPCGAGDADAESESDLTAPHKRDSRSSCSSSSSTSRHRAGWVGAHRTGWPDLAQRERGNGRWGREREGGGRGTREVNEGGAGRKARGSFLL
jgi:hypothetical protein